MAATAVWSMICILFLLISVVSISQGSDHYADDEYFDEGVDNEYNEPENFHMAEEADSYDYEDNSEEDSNGFNRYDNENPYNGEDKRFGNGRNEMEVKKAKKPKHLLKKTLKRKKTDQVKNTNPYQHSHMQYPDSHMDTEEGSHPQKHKQQKQSKPTTHKHHQQQQQQQQQRKVEQIQSKKQPPLENQQPPQKQQQQKQQPQQQKQQPQQQKQQPQQQKQQPQQQKQQPQQQKQQPHQPQQQTEQSQGNQQQQKQVHQTQHRQQHSQAGQQNQQNSPQTDKMEQVINDPEGDKKADLQQEEDMVLSDITDSDPKINELLKSESFLTVRKQQIKDYIKSHFPNQPLQKDVLMSIDTLITSNLVKDLKVPGSRLNRMLTESAGIKDDTSTPDKINSIQDSVVANINKQEHAKVTVGSPSETPTESSLEANLEPTPASQTTVNEQVDTPKPAENSAQTMNSNDEKHNVELHSDNDESKPKTVLETDGEHQIKRKNLMKNAMKGMQSHMHNGHAHDSVSHKQKHDNLDEVSSSSDQGNKDIHDNVHDTKTSDLEAGGSPQTDEENKRQSEQLPDANENHKESETHQVNVSASSQEEKASHADHEGIKLPDEEPKEDTQGSVEPKVEDKSSEESNEKAGFLGGIFDYFSGETEEKTPEVAAHEKSTGNEPIHYPAINEPDVNEPDDNEPDVKEPDVKEPDVKEPDDKDPHVKEPEEELRNEEPSHHEDSSVKEAPATPSPTFNENNEVVKPTELPNDFKDIHAGDKVSNSDQDDEKDSAKQQFMNDIKESVDMEHEKSKYTEAGQLHEQTQVDDKENQAELNSDKTSNKESPNPTERDDPLYKLCEQHPTLQACKKIKDNSVQREEEEEKAAIETPKSGSSSDYIKTFTRWMNSWFYFFFVYIFSCFKTAIIFIWMYSCGMFLNLIGQQEISQLVLNSIDEMSLEKFAVIFIFVINHVIFYWYFKNSNMGPLVKVIRHKGPTKVVDDSKIEELQIDIKKLNETTARLEKDLQQESENKRELEEKVSAQEEEKKKLSLELTELKNKLSEAEGEKEKGRQLQEQIKSYKEVIEKLETELRISNTTLDSTKEDLDTMKTDYKQLDDKFVYVIKELDTKDVAISKMEEKEKKLKEELEGKENICKEKDDTISEQNSRIDSLLEEKSNSEQSLEESNKRCHDYQLEIEVLQECLLAVNKVSVDHETSSEFDNVEDDQEIDAEQLKAERLAKIMDATKAQAELKDIKNQYELCQEELNKYCSIASDSEAKYTDIWSKFEELSKEASELRKSLEKKDIELSTISKFFADRESDYQKAGMSQAEDIKILRKQIDSIGDNDKQVNILLKQVQDLKDEIQTNEKQYKQQVSTVEEQSHNNYIKMRTAIRECEEHKREKEVYRKRLLDIDMSPKFKPTVKASTPVSSKTPSERAASPTNSNKSTEDNSRTESPRPSLPAAPSFGPRMYPGMPPPFSPRPPFGMRMMGPYGVPPHRPFMPSMNPARLPGSPGAPISMANQPIRAREQRPNAPMMAPNMSSPMMPPNMANPMMPPNMSSPMMPPNMSSPMMPPNMSSPMRPPQPLPQMRGMYPTPPPPGVSTYSMPNPPQPMVDRAPRPPQHVERNHTTNTTNAGV